MPRMHLSTQCALYFDMVEEIGEMKQQDIKAVLTQAAQLRANICIAIDKSLQAHFHNLPISSAAAHELENGEYDDDEYAVLPISSVTAASAASEARSLASIRDALEVLEEQLECLQYLPDQQRAERNATLAELEESRGILIRRLKQHRGRELAVIKEALSFAGEPKDEEFLLRRSYTLPETAGEDDFCDEDVCIRMDMGRKKPHRKGNALSSNDKTTPSRGRFNNLKSRILIFLNRRLARVSGKCLLAVAGAAAVLTLSNVAYGNNMCGRKLASSSGRQRAGTCPKNWTPGQSGGQRCMLVEPFKEES